MYSRWAAGAAGWWGARARTGGAAWRAAAGRGPVYMRALVTVCLHVHEVYTYTYTYTYIYTYTCKSNCVFVCITVCAYIYTHTSVRFHLHACTHDELLELLDDDELELELEELLEELLLDEDLYTCGHLLVSVFMCIYTHIYIYMVCVVCVYIYIYIYIYSYIVRVCIWCMYSRRAAGGWWAWGGWGAWTAARASIYLFMTQSEEFISRDPTCVFSSPTYMWAIPFNLESCKTMHQWLPILWGTGLTARMEYIAYKCTIQARLKCSNQ